MHKKILICCGTGCLANGSQAVVDEFISASLGMEVDILPDVKKVGCNGFCENGPIVTILPDHITYYKVHPKDVEDILGSLNGEPVERLLYKDDAGKPVLSREENPFYASQLKIALRNTGMIDPGNIDDYIGTGGYEALRKALSYHRKEVIKEIEISGLRGRGGAGFPTGKKWRSCFEVPGETKYMLCNGDEGDPGAFMDRSILEGDPHSVLEGLIIGAYAIGASQGYFYIRDEYGLALAHVQKALEEARARGYLGHNILNSGFSFDCEIVRGGGAFVCGESSALMASIEGKVGEPRVKYIRSVEKGLFEKPTVLNNVETLANVPYIIFHGGTEYAKLGTDGSKGTKVFSLVGKVNRTGLVEVPMGITLRDLVFQIGGGISENRKFKAVQTGGPSGGCIPEKLMDLEIDFDSLKDNGSMMGSGGIIVMDESTCMVELARYYVNFLAGESCGKCTPCREGLRCMLEILTRICEGNGEPSDLDLLEELSYTASLASLCELGRTAANPVMSTIKYFKDEYIEHIDNKRCPAGACKSLILYEIAKEKCRGCSLCAKNCPVNAIKGELKKTYEIDQDVCIKCGTCLSKCPFDAITVL
ncbi:NADH-ubiquinone oxidoreductase-F iron-sulfur binding region domain-containing protein [Sinanaerobacter chloroacetimidivorans]|uniref:4Fe-4S binding protein n=1 Tax=Sinanaerobacter chloroacetimidivorans TaxID=2818044 RepID=A0A8J7W035_9FIRM|nr:NADH-ubiquinone oxidoreductase-F iron-sulfur binding region domain-containing protein [Sinanaerobacter chloroacetimidivorans]MBR0597889.1 4Fe-4S binding protein [Sinanaerobacter chloroacetimidivorans]